ADSATAGPFARRPSVYRPPISQPTVARAPVLRRDTVGKFESRLRWSHRWRWLAPTLVVGVAAIAVGVYMVRDVAADPDAREVRSSAIALALADDVRSLEEAAAALQRAVVTAPEPAAARADRALVELLLAGALTEPDARGERRERAKKLAASASATLDELARANTARPEVARARAVAASLGASRAELKRLATAALAELPDDPLVALAEHAADVRSTDRSARERALGELRLVIARRPELVRARYLLAKGLALAGRHKEALAAAEELLRRNPRHEGAAGLRETVTRPPATAPIAPPAAPAPDAASPERDGAAPAPDVAAAEPSPPPPRPENSALLPRKASSTDGERRSAPPAEPAADAGSPDAAAGGLAPAPAEVEPPPAPRLRPAAVPEPEVVEGGG
ncbi:MAG TPA: hypothetical protein VEA99_01130, partial [Gemmatimonadaceae bacterium]|nr:hypothetical protein [Gemmatimonadaceae bacterium]